VIDIKSQTLQEVRAQLQSWGEPGYRAPQLLDWVYVHRATEWDAMSSLPKKLRDLLRGHYSLHSLELVKKQGSRDETQKFLWRLKDHSLIESVLIAASPALYGEASDRHTLCVSTQVGCAYGCKFCASGLEGWKRNLTVEEIVDQVLAVERWNDSQEAGEPRVSEVKNQDKASREGGAGQTTKPSRLVSNLVIMGMGEPLANYKNLLTALKILNAS